MLGGQICARDKMTALRDKLPGMREFMTTVSEPLKVRVLLVCVF